MILLADRQAMTRALQAELDPQLHALLADRFAALTTDRHDLTDWTEYLIVQPFDVETDIEHEVGFSPLVDPDGYRFPDPAFQPFWDWMVDHGGWYELSISFGSAFAYVLFVRNDDGVPDDLLELCRRYAGRPT